MWGPFLCPKGQSFSSGEPLYTGPTGLRARVRHAHVACGLVHNEPERKATSRLYSAASCGGDGAQWSPVTRENMVLAGQFRQTDASNLW